jgi:hypothetical protein
MKHPCLQLGLHRIYLVISIALIPCFGFNNKVHTNLDSNTTWGFYAHKLLNKLAVFTLPAAMIEFYKTNLEYISHHAVDPDKRRYAIKGEAERHYIDLDQWKKETHLNLPDDLLDCILQSSEIKLFKNLDSVLVFEKIECPDIHYKELKFTNSFKNNFLEYRDGIELHQLKEWLLEYAWMNHEDENWIIETDLVAKLFPTANLGNYKMHIIDHFSPHGILPYFLPQIYKRLVKAFQEKDVEKILKLSSDIGHYIGDAHVPLHTTKNYNGQLSNQTGIHAFWESRIPELFAEQDFDFVVGHAESIRDIRSYFWKIIEDSHQCVDSVLRFEKSLSQTTPSDQQYCFEMRLGEVTKLPCKDYAASYHTTLDRQVERRFRSCILSIGSVWMSAWTEAGQPDLTSNTNDHQALPQIKTDSLLESAILNVRDHE